MAVRDTEATRVRNEAVIREIPNPHPDPITGAPGAHPVGVGVGAAAGATAGAIAGSVIPGAGTLLGAAIGTIVGAFGGGLAGKGVAEAIDPSVEDVYWRDNLSRRPYYNDQYTYDVDYAPAYGYGYVTRPDYTQGNFDEHERKLAEKWDKVKGKSRLTWDQARYAVSDAWNRYDENYRPTVDESARDQSGMRPPL